MRPINLRLTLASAIMLACPLALSAQADKMDRKDGMAMDHDAMKMAVATGVFTGAEDHKASGSYDIVREKGKLLLKTSADLDVDRAAPDVYVVLARGARVGKDNGVWLGRLTGHTGTQTLVVPAGAKFDGLDTVVLWCKKYGVPIGVAPFDPAGLAMKDMMDKKGN